MLLAVGIIGPKYLDWRSTSYHLSNDALYVKKRVQPIMRRRIVKHKFEAMAKMETKYGFLGERLGYAEVSIILTSNSVARLKDMSNYSEFMRHISNSPDFPQISEATE